ncbi:hypothetical protein B0G80_5010 [Paraburkholderia sp. BL6669N2]|uniref:hypothetical protein n=1 Tax=Paraburkholderia sp. BL6669N2 TaxID=1938807 RepID=UPI000E27BE9C|nr:hypothetical protein [Paraburkholderia sp. BL6669N2]REG48724.1 hypothetical protein B0G80_5010 [Paraburkholderia sp. BL6669N2]
MNQTSSAQEREKIFYEVPDENSKYTLLHLLDVEDIPGHSLALYELHRTFSKGALMFAGVSATEQWLRGTVDTVDGNGTVIGYGFYNLENGDKILGRFDGISQSAMGQSPEVRTVIGSTMLTGGTGKMRGIRGILHFVTNTDVSKRLNESKCEGEYWMEKE